MHVGTLGRVEILHILFSVSGEASPRTLEREHWRENRDCGLNGINAFRHEFHETQTRGAVMPGNFLEVQPRDFNPRAIPALTNEARDAVNAALKAMSTWRNEISDTSEKNGKQVIEKMAAAAAALGWPEQIVDAARTQLQGIAETDDRLAVGDVVQAEILPELQCERKLAKPRRFPEGRDEPLADVGANGGAVAEILGRHLEQDN